MLPNMHLLGVTIALWAVAACSGPRHADRPGTTGATGHRQSAETHTGHASAEEAHDPRQLASGRALTGGQAGGAGSRVGEAAALAAADRAHSHRQHAQQHIGRAQALEAFEFGACLGVSAKRRATCPLAQPTVIIERTALGLRITAGDGADVGETAAHIRCHQAFGTAHGFADMQSCPLYVNDVIVADGPRGSIELNGRNRAAIEELWRRAFGPGGNDDAD